MSIESHSTSDCASAQQLPSYPEVEHVPTGIRAGIAAAVANRLFGHAVRDLPIRVEYPDGTVLGRNAVRPDQPRLILHRPDDFFARLGSGGLIGFGESYMAGDWSAPDLTAAMTVFARHVDTLVPAPLQRLRRLYVAKHLLRSGITNRTPAAILPDTTTCPMTSSHCFSTKH